MGKKKYSSKLDKYLTFPLLVLDDIVLTPVINSPIKIEDEKQIEMLNYCSDNHFDIFISSFIHQPTKDKWLTKIGLLCHVEKVLQMPGAPALAFLRPRSRALLMKIETQNDFSTAVIDLLPGIHNPKRKTKDLKNWIQHIENLFEEVMNFLAEPEKIAAKRVVEENSDEVLKKIYAIGHVAPFSAEERYKIMECYDLNSLLEVTATLLDQTLQRINLQAKIHERTHRELSQQQKETFLRTHIRQIQQELGEADESDDFANLLAKSADKRWDEKTAKHFKKELDKLRRLNINNPEYSVQYSYLENFLELPWENYIHSSVSLPEVEKILNRDHYGLKKVKERILEYMAVVKLRDDLKAPIICLYGPPGVGKTSIGKSIAEAVGREYARISLGGMHDESEIRGHRRTYIGSMPGRFLQTLAKLKYGNPLILLDEIDKVGKDYKGDPSAALLEALDPEQNNTFHDNFIDFPYDLSKVLFIATANDLSTIPGPLRDRMEIIEMTGYIPAEKREIALRHLVDKVLRENGFNEKEVEFSPEAIDLIIRFYTREAGVRQLEKKIGKIVRKLAVLKASDKGFPKLITPDLAEQYLGNYEVNPDSYENNDFAGVATGLAWTPSGGDILFIETSLAPGKGEKISLTGNLGDVMKESATIALQYIKANADKIGINPEMFTKYDIHIHVPDGAVPKDGPSAGITLATSMASAFLGKKIKDHLAMTGEITLRGKVLPVGGIKEKIMAARQAGIKTVILSEENKKDIEEIPEIYLEGLSFIYVKTIAEVLSHALLKEDAQRV